MSHFARAGFLGKTMLASALLMSSCHQSPLPPPAAEAGERAIAIAAAADLKFALEEVLVAFRAAHPAIRAEASYGSSGNFFAQLQNRAPFDVFLSADAAYPRKLEEAGLVVKGSDFKYALGRVVLWVPQGSGIDVEKLGVQALVDPAAHKVAIANPAHAPYGRAAEAAIKHFGLYEAVLPKLVLGENIAQTAQFVESGAADIGVIALSLALSAPMKGKGHFWQVPADAHPALEQAGVILAWAKDPGAASELCAFMISAKGRSILEGYGFVVPQ